MITDNIEIGKNRTGEIKVTVTGITDWTGLSSKFIASVDYGSEPLITLEGVINEPSNEITFTYLVATTADLTVSRLKYEVVIYNAAKTLAKTATNGILTIAPSVGDGSSIN